MKKTQLFAYSFQKRTSSTLISQRLDIKKHKPLYFSILIQ